MSELATNALLHTASGNGGKFTVILKRGKSWVWVAVCDDGSDKSPIVRALDAASEDGRGLGLVALIADRWGELSDKHGRAVWIELRWDTGLATRRYSERPERGSVPS